MNYTRWTESRRQFILQRLITILEDSLLDENGEHYELRPNGEDTTFDYPYEHFAAKGERFYRDYQMGITYLEEIDAHARTKEAIKLLKAEQ